MMLGTIALLVCIPAASCQVAAGGAQTAATDAVYEQLLQERRESAVIAFDVLIGNYLSMERPASESRVYAASCRLLDATLAIQRRPAVQIEAYARHARTMNCAALYYTTWINAGLIPGDPPNSFIQVAKDAETRWIEAHRRLLRDRPPPLEAFDPWFREFRDAMRARTILEGVLFVKPSDGKLPTEPRRIGTAAPAEPVDVRKHLKAAIDTLINRPDLADPTDELLLRLKKERYRAVRREFEGRLNLFAAGSARGSIDELCSCLDRFRDAECALIEKPVDRLPTYELMAQIAQGLEAAAKARFDAGEMSISDFEQCRYYRLDAQIKLMELKKSVGAAAGK
jgi:hypothetical protein